MKAEARCERHEEMAISIDLCNKEKGKYFGVCLIEPKSPVTHSVLVEVADLLHTRLQSLLTQRNQDEATDYPTFRRTSYPMIQKCIDDIAAFFGEDATVSMDLNLEYHGSRAMRHLYEADLKIAFGVVRQEGWHTIMLGEGWQEQIMEWMA